MIQKGSFIGFTFGNRHSSKMGIFRTSQSNRYSINLLPELKEMVYDNQIEGQYYWNTEYTKRDISISFAFYGLTEDQIVLLKKTFNDKKIHDLILDEEPYKVWSAKLTGVSVIKHLSFELNGQRFYHGEGSFVFTTYYPYARSRYQYLEDYTLENVLEWIEDGSILTDEFGTSFIYPAILQYDFSEEEDTAKIIGVEEAFKIWLEEENLLIDSELDLQGVESYVDIFSEKGPYYNLEEWREASNLPSSSEYGQYINGAYKLFNAGDIEMPFKLYIPFDNITSNIKLECNEDKIEINTLQLQDKGSTDAYLVIDTYRYLIYGCDLNYSNTGTIYNNLIINGDFFNLPQGEIELKSSIRGELKFNYFYL